jgi:glycosyltransferase involved in cell wall biosynthesis
MISIIICSREKSIKKDLIENIKNSVGCEFELIIMGNSENNYSIFEAYNLGIEKSRGDFLCFMHDDIYIHTIDWGCIINRIFNENQEIGLIGVAGAKIKTTMPSTWWDCPEDQYVIQIIQHFNNKEPKTLNYGFQNALCHEVAVIDGVFMVMRKDSRIHFSTEMDGFHNYDLNLSFECRKLDYKVIVTNEILIEHFSIGTINDSWYESAYKLYKLYSIKLPRSVNGITDSKLLDELEFKNGMHFINKMVILGKNKKALKIWFKLFLLKPMSKFHFGFIKKLINIC